MNCSGDRTQSTAIVTDVENAATAVGTAPDPTIENGQPNEATQDSLTQSEAERLQREANEDTTRSEDLRLFLKEMHEKLKEEQQQPPQPASMGPPLYPQPTNVSASEYSLPGHQPPVSGLTRDMEGDVQQVIRRSSVPTVTKMGNHTNKAASITDLTSPDTAPDGGWGWVVVLGSFCCMILVDGVSLSYGLLLTPECGYSSLHVLSTSNNAGNRSLPQFRTGVSSRDRTLRPTFGSCAPISEMGEAIGTQNRAILFTPGALLLGVYLLLGPLVSALTNQFDFRPVAMAGAMLSTVAFLISAFAHSIELLIGGFGILGGVGFALIYLPAIATVGHWFQQSRPLAVGLALCGSGVGCLLGAQAVPRLVDWLTWRGALIVMAATSFQALSLIVLFRPLEVHLRICHAQRIKRAAREAARRAAALRRAEAELRLLESRQRKRISAAKVATAQALEYQHKQQQQQQQYKQLAGRNMGNSPSVIHRIDARTGAMLQTHGMLRGTANRPRMGTIVARTGRGGRMFTVTTAANQQGSVLVGVDPARQNTGIPHRGATGWLRSRTHSGRNQPVKRAPSRRVVDYRGSIMQRIIEEKRRQRTTSVGSLDGMVITRDNELIAAPMGAGYDRPLLSASVIHRIAESAARKIELKMQQQQTSGVGDGAVGSRLGLSRSQLRVNLPQVVQGYIQSQLSVVQHKQSMNLTNPSSIGLPTSGLPPQVPVAPVSVRPTSIVEPPGPPHMDPSTGAAPPPPVSPVTPVPPAPDGSLVVSPGHSTPVNPTPPSTVPTGQTDPSQDVLQAPIISLKHQPANLVVSNCASETTSLRHTLSNSSLESRVPQTGAGTTLVDGGVLPVVDPAELLDDEIKAHINARLRRELARPQHKKDLFYTGSVMHLDSGQVVTEHAIAHPNAVVTSSMAGAGVLRRHVSSVIYPSRLILSTNTGLKVRASVAVTPQPVTVEPMITADLHNSQTNISVATSIGTGGTTFIPPAPCPTLPPAPVCLPPVAADPVDMYSSQQQDTVSTNFTRSGQLESRLICPDGQSTITVLQPSCTTAYAHARSAEPLSGAADDLVSRLEAVENEDLDIEDDDLDVVDGGDSVDDDDVDEDEMDGGGGFYSFKSAFRDWYGCTLASFWCTKCCTTMSDKLSPMRTFFQELLSPWILTSRTFLFMLLSSTATMMGYVIPFFLLPDLLAELNWTLADSGFAISAIGVGNTVGRLVATVYIEKAWSTTYRWANSLWLNNASLLLTSVAVSVMPLLRTHYTFLVFVCLVFGFCSAVFVSLKSILVVELLGLEQLTNSFGYMLLFQGLAAVIGPPVAGVLRDLQLERFAPHDILTAHLAPIHNAASMGFYFSGACLFLACLLACPLRWLSRMESTQVHPSNTAEPAFDLIAGHQHEPGGIPSQVGDVEFFIGLPDQTGVINFGASISDAFNVRAAESSGEQKSLPPNNTNVDSAAGVLQAATVVVGQPPALISNVMTSAGGAAPALVDLSGPPCILATINEAVPVVAAAAPTPADVTLPAVSAPNTDDISVFDGLPASILPCTLVIPAAGVAVPVVAGAPCAPSGSLGSQAAAAVEVIGVQEESGLEPVVEEEEEEEYEDDQEPEPLPPHTRSHSGEPGSTNEHFDVVTLPDDRATSDQPSAPDQTRSRRKKRRKVIRKPQDGLEPSTTMSTTSGTSGSDESAQHSQHQGSTDQSGSSIQSQPP